MNPQPEVLFAQDTPVHTTTLPNGTVEDRVIRKNAAGETITAVARFSADRTYRYLLARNWRPDVHSLLFIMLNPSTASAMADDHTIRRCMYYARRHHFGGITVANLFALRATNPRDLLRHPDPAGPANHQTITDLVDGFSGSRPAIAAWGAYDQRLGIYAQAVTDLFTDRGYPLHRLGPPTAGGFPRHPSRLSNDVELQVHAGGPS